MKKMKRVALVLLLIAIVMLSCGCGVSNGTSMGVDIVEELYKERDTKYEMSFGENTAIVDLENMYDYMDDDSYFTLSAKKGAGLEVKNHNNVAYEDLDESPDAGDKEELLVFVIIAIIMLMVMIAVAITIIKQWAVSDKK